MQAKTYKIQDKKLTQGELTLGQDKALIALANEIKGDTGGMPETVQEMLQWLVERDLLTQVLDIILKGDTDAIVWDDVTNSDLEEIVTDFLALNAGWIGKLIDLLNSLMPPAVMQTAAPGAGN